MLYIPNLERLNREQMESFASTLFPKCVFCHYWHGETKVKLNGLCAIKLQKYTYLIKLYNIDCSVGI